MKTTNYNIRLDPKLSSDTLLAIQETEQILEEYTNGSRMTKPFANASENT